MCISRTGNDLELQRMLCEVESAKGKRGTTKHDRATKLDIEAKDAQSKHYVVLF